MKALVRAAAAAMLEALAHELRADASPEKGTGGSPEKGTGVEEEKTPEGPSIYTGPETYLENPGHRGDELMHSETRRGRWHEDDYDDNHRPHGTRRIGF